ALLVLLLICSSANFSYAQTDDERTLFSYINKERVREGLSELVWDDDLYKVAVAHSKDMAKHDTVSHREGRSLPDDRIRKAGILVSKSGENVACDINVISAHTALMESLYHRENILDPEFTRGAVGITPRETHFFVTELFIRKLEDFGTDAARTLLLSTINDFRKQKNLLPLAFSDALNKMAQSHVEVESKMDSLGPPLTMDLMARQMKGTVRVNVYTTTALLEIPTQVQPNLELNNQSIGIGYKRIKGSACVNGCYLITLVLGPAS
ncbi:MAG TPA: CAP domain-containing protein, partial [Acidobacteriota bacterium]|nr:CAP domain-containing protein [Acidobacteriota bacterium]